MIIRPEQSHDVETLHAVERAAFEREAEADLVDQIRASLERLRQQGHEIMVVGGLR